VKKIEKFDIFRGNLPNPNHKWLIRPGQKYLTQTRHYLSTSGQSLTPGCHTNKKFPDYAFQYKKVGKGNFKI